MKPTDKAVPGTVSESPGRNVSEPSGGLDKNELRRPSPLVSGEGCMAWRRLTEAARHSGGGVRGSTVTRTCRATGETVLVPPEKLVEQVSRITGDPGKSAEDETAAARLAVATKRGNARGAKGPCCIGCLQQGEAGVR